MTMASSSTWAGTKVDDKVIGNKVRTMIVGDVAKSVDGVEDVQNNISVRSYKVRPGRGARRGAQPQPACALCSIPAESSYQPDRFWPSRIRLAFWENAIASP